MKKETAQDIIDDIFDDTPVDDSVVPKLVAALLATNRTARKECLAIVNSAWDVAELMNDAHAMDALDRAASDIRATILEDENG